MDWRKIEDGQGDAGRLVVAPCPWWPHPPRESRGPSPLGPGGTPLEPALTHSTSGAVTGSNARLGTSKDLSSRSRDALPTLSCPRYTAPRCSDYSTRRGSQPRSRFIPSGSFHDLSEEEEWLARVHAGDLGPRKGERGRILFRRGEISPRNICPPFLRDYAVPRDIISETTMERVSEFSD